MSFDKLTASKINNLLFEKHKEDIYISECKMGSAGSRQLDAWVLKKTWSPKTAIGYEIKVSRSDFLQDQKWTEYLKACNQFYFVCPWKMISEEELPENVGLMYSSKNGTRLYTRRKAVHRKEPLCEDLLFYILMHRVKITSSTFGYKQYKQNPKKYWQMWLKDKKLDWEFGEMVSKKISERVQDKITNVERKIRSVQQENERLQETQKVIDELNEAGISTWDLKRIKKEGVRAVLQNEADHFKRELSSLKSSIDKVESKIDQKIEEVSA